MKTITKKIDVTSILAISNNIIIGENIGRELLNSLTIPNSKKTLDIFFSKNDIEITDTEKLFHFLTLLRTLLYRISPLKQQDFLLGIEVVDTIYDRNKLILEVNYIIE